MVGRAAAELCLDRGGHLPRIYFSAPPAHESLVGVGWWGFNQAHLPGGRGEL
jgi:hypothetical protein